MHPRLQDLRAANDLKQHRLDFRMIATARMLRLGMGVLALLFPFLLWGIGGWYGLKLQASMSDYYIAWPADQCGFFPARDILVGLLCAISSGLIAYRGFTRLEDWLLDVAGVAGFVIAFFPNNLEASQASACAALKPIFDGQQQGIPLLHDAASAVMFVALGAVVIACGRKTLPFIKSKAWRESLDWTYIGIGVLMVLTPAAGFLVNELFQLKSKIFFTEAFALELFAVYWLLKLAELWITGGEQKLLGVVDIAPPDRPGPGGAEATAA